MCVVQTLGWVGECPTCPGRCVLEQEPPSSCLPTSVSVSIIHICAPRTSSPQPNVAPSHFHGISIFVQPYIYPQTSLSVSNRRGPQRCEEKALTPRSMRCLSSLCFSTAHRGCSPLLTSPHGFPSAATALHGFSSAIALQPLALPQPCPLRCVPSAPCPPSHVPSDVCPSTMSPQLPVPPAMSLGHVLHPCPLSPLSPQPCPSSMSLIHISSAPCPLSHVPSAPSSQPYPSAISPNPPVPSAPSSHPCPLSPLSP